MSSNFEDLTPTPNNWFSTTIEYRGHGVAEFYRPSGIIEGPTVIQFDERGEHKITMEVSVFKPERQMTFGLLQFFSGNEPIKQENSISLGFGGINNYCTRLTVSTEEGTFEAQGKINCSFSGAAFFGGVQGTNVHFYPLVSVFSANTDSAEKYWVMPLSNFVSMLSMPQNTPFDQHPLRIYPTPIVPKGLTREDELTAYLHANQKNSLIIFRIEQSFGFIEALADYEIRKGRLINGVETNTITAVMVGEILEKIAGIEEFKNVVPVDFLPILGLVTGSEVGAPWVEVRDENGALLQRIHKSFGKPKFARGHNAIRQDIHGGIGYLLTKSYASDAFGKSFLRVAIKHLIRAGTHVYSIEDRLRQLFTTFDNLCEEYGIGKVETLSPERQKEVERIIAQCVDAINQLMPTTISPEDENDVRLIRRIAGNVNQSKVIRTNFGANAAALIEKFGLPDVEIIERFYRESPRSDKRKWIDVIPYFRGIVMHKGFFDFEGRHKIDDVVVILDHLHDVMLRIIFIILGYDQNYQPPTIKQTTSVRTDWVQEDTPPSRLGYGKLE